MPEGEGGGDVDDGEPVVGVAFPAGGDAAPVVEPAVGAFDDPAVAGVGVAWAGCWPVGAADDGCAGGDGVAGAAAFADHGLDAAFGDGVAQWLAVVAAVGPELVGAQAAGEELVQQRQQLLAFVVVAGPDRQRKGGAAGVD